MMEPTVKVKLWVLTLLAAAAVACGSAPRTYHYTVNLKPMASGSAALAGSQLGVALPRASHLLRQDRIVYFTSEKELNYYQYHRWAEPPVFMVQSMLIRQLQAAGLFDNIVPYRAQKGLDYVLQGRLLAMEEVDTGPQVAARFALELEMVRESDKHVVWTGRHACEQPVSTKTVAAVVEGISGCLQESLDELIASLHDVAVQLERAATETETDP
ncbi:MAG: ABC-type transport auxiliary lipoprotein family protein [Terriglobia bacterium]